MVDTDREGPPRPHRDGRRGLALIAALVAAVVAAGCGPAGLADSGGPAVAPVETANAVPTPNGLDLAPPAEDVEAAGLAEALGGDVAQRERALERSGFIDAAVRTWTGDERELTIAVGVFSSHGAALTVAGSASEPVLKRPDGRAWTPSGLGGSRGARAEDAPEERVLGAAVGPNALVVRARGPVQDEVLVRSLEHLSALADR